MITAAARRALIEAPLPTVRYIPSKSWAGVLRDPELKFANRMDRDPDSADMAAFLTTRGSGSLFTSGRGIQRQYDVD